MKKVLFPFIQEADEMNKDKIIQNLVNNAIDTYYKNKLEGNNEKIQLRRLFRNQVVAILKRRGIDV